MARRKQRDEERVSHVVEQFAAVLEGYGFPRMSGRVVMQLMVSEGPGLTAAELAERLQVSPAAVSTSVRFLVQIGLAQRVRVPGERRDRYLLPDDAWYTVTASKQPVYQRIAGLAAEGVEAVGGRATEAGARLEGMRDFFEYLGEEVPALVERWQNGQPRRVGGSSAPVAQH